MNGSAPTFTADTSGPESPAERLARYADEPVTAGDIDQLLRLAALGMELAEEVAQEARAENTADPAVRTQRRRDFDRMARIVRLTLALKTRLLFAHHAWLQRCAKAEAEAAAPDAADKRRSRQRDKILAAAEEVVAATQPEHEILKEPGGLGRWYDERDRETPLSGRTVGEVIAELCKSIAVTPDWHRWRGRSWAKDAKAASPPAPYVPPEIEIEIYVPAPVQGDPPVVCGYIRKGVTYWLPGHEPPAAETPPLPEEFLAEEFPPEEFLAEEFLAEEPPPEEPAPPPRPPPITRPPRNGDPPLTPEQIATYKRRLASDPFYKPSPWFPL